MPFALHHDGYDDVSLDHTPVTILCNSFPMDISRNLFDFLDEYHRRCIRENRPSEYLWVDAICINQADVAERGSQVSMMGDIYASAGNVVIWLGKNTTDMGHLKDLIYSRVYDVLQDHEASIRGFPKTTQDLQNYGFQNTLHQWTENITGFFRALERRRYFYRAWVYQECAIAVDPIVWCGGFEIPLQRISAFWFAIFESEWCLDVDFYRSVGLKSNFPEILGVGSANCIESVLPQFPDDDFNLTKAERWYGYVSYLLEDIRDSECSDDRDKVFVIAGLANRFAPAGIRLEPDYTKSVRDVYIKTATDLILHRPGLAALYHRETPTRDRWLPSWVPDFARKERPRFLAWKVFDVCRGMDLSAYPLPGVSDTSILTITGARFDEVTFVSRPGLLSFRSFEETRSALPETYAHIQQSTEEALWRTILGDVIFDPVEKGYHCPVPDNIISKLQSRLASEREAMAAVHPLLKAEFDGSCIYHLATTHLGSRNQRLFITSNGCLGLGPQYMVEGDEVYLLLGARTPFVLRKIPSEDQYMFIGYAYIHGFMHGEMAETARNQLGPVHIA